MPSRSISRRTFLKTGAVATAASNTFERIKRINPDGAEFCSARELGRVLEYTDFRNFVAVITRARQACANSGHAVSDHFVEPNEKVDIGSGAQRTIEDWALSRYALAFSPCPSP